MMKEITRDNFSILFGSDGYLKLVNFVYENNFKKILILTDENTKVHCLDLFLSNIKKTDKKIAEMISSNSYYFSVEPYNVFIKSLSLFGIQYHDIYPEYRIIGLKNNKIDDVIGKKEIFKNNFWFWLRVIAMVSAELFIIENASTILKLY